MARSVRCVAREYAEEDLILVPNAGTLNMVRFYALQEGRNDFDVRCVVDWTGQPGHVNHVSSLQSSDLIWGHREVRQGRVWAINGAGAHLADVGWRLEFIAEFVGSATNLWHQYRDERVVVSTYRKK